MTETTHKEIMDMVDAYHSVNETNRAYNEAYALMRYRNRIFAPRDKEHQAKEWLEEIKRQLVAQKAVIE